MTTIGGQLVPNVLATHDKDVCRSPCNMPKRCPKCGGNELQSVDQYIGTCAHSHGEPMGYTEMWWDTCTEQAQECTECDWTHVHDWAKGYAA